MSKVHCDVNGNDMIQTFQIEVERITIITIFTAYIHISKTNKRRLQKVEITFLIKSWSSYLQIFPIFLYFISCKTKHGRIAERKKAIICYYQPLVNKIMWYSNALGVIEVVW